MLVHFVLVCSLILGFVCVDYFVLFVGFADYCMLALVCCLRLVDLHVWLCRFCGFDLL